jgi:hypothetical protein
VGQYTSYVINKGDVNQIVSEDKAQIKQNTQNLEYTNPYKLGCPEGYLRAGNFCCEDNNNNGVCDYVPVGQSYTIFKVLDKYLNTPNIEKNQNLSVELVKIIEDPIYSFNRNMRFYFNLKNEGDKELSLLCKGIVFIDDFNRQISGLCDFSDTLYPGGKLELVGSFNNLTIGERRWVKVILNIGNNLFEYHVDLWSQPKYDCSGSFDIKSGRIRITKNGYFLDLDVFNPSKNKFEVQLIYIFSPSSDKQDGGVGGPQLIEISDSIQTLSWNTYVGPDVDSLELRCWASCDSLSESIKVKELQVIDELQYPFV